MYIKDWLIRNFPNGAMENNINASLEDILHRSERKDTFFRKLIIRAAGLFGTVPEMTFDRDDVDMDIVAKLQKHPLLLKAIDDWIWWPDYGLTPRLKEAQKVFSAIQKPKLYPKLYRGFKIGEEDQDGMGLQKEHRIKLGDVFNYNTANPMSFTHFKGTASLFGTIVISVNTTQHAKYLLDLTPEVIYSLFHLNGVVNKAPYWFTYGEVIILPSNKPLRCTVESIGKIK